MKGEPVELNDRLRARVAREWGSSTEGCWNWPLAPMTNGYGQVGVATGGKTVNRLVHRIAWEIQNGPIPAGLTIDHLCRNRRCFNPSHLRLLTHSENCRNNGQSVRTCCPAGHPYDLVDGDGTRRCRSCRRAQARAAYRARKAR